MILGVDSRVAPQSRTHGHVAVSLFSGCGGCSLGLRSAGFEIAIGAEINPDACDTYRANVSTRLLTADLAQVDTRTLLRVADAEPSDIHLLAAGPPCQSFTSAGMRDWNDPRNLLLHRTVDLIAEVRPPWVVIENVEGLLTAQRGFYFVESIVRLLRLGYWVKAKKVYMETYGVPQRRKRVLIVANRVGCDYEFPEATHSNDQCSDLFGAPPPFSIMDAIGDLDGSADDSSDSYKGPPQNILQEVLRRDLRQTTWHQAKKVNATTQTRIRAMTSGQTMRDLPDELQHASFKRRAWRRVMDGTPTEQRGGAPAGMKRLVGTEPSLTITSATTSEFIHPELDRLLTLRECARIQTFPDDFRFSGSWASVATQIGNAIPPMFMSLLASDIAGRDAWVGKPLLGRWLGISASRSLGHSPALASMLRELEARTREYA